MKKLILFCLFIIFTQSATARDLKIRVIALGKPLGYSYVYINGDVKDATDSTGVLFLPKSWFEIGDTISASFVGFEGSQVIYDENIKYASEVTLDLSNSFMLDDIIVGADIRKIYKRYVRKHKLDIENVMFSMQFKRVIQTDSTKSMRKGGISIIYSNIESKKSRNAYKYSDFRVECDTVDIVNSIMHAYYYSTVNRNIVDWAFRYNHRFDSRKTSYEYNGIEGGNRIFTLVVRSEKELVQHVYYIDMHSGMVKNAATSAIFYDKYNNIDAQYEYEWSYGLLKNILTVVNGKFKIKNLKEKWEQIVHLHNITVEKLVLPYSDKAEGFVGLRFYKDEIE